MIRTQIQLTARQYRLLKDLAKRESVSMAELIRRAIDLFEASDRARSDKELRERAKKVAGRFNSGLPDISARHDDYFADSILP